MSEFTSEELEGIVNAIAHTPQEQNEIPLRPPGSYTTLAKVSLSHLEGEEPRPLAHLTEKELGCWDSLKATVEVVFGKTKMTLKELAAIKEGSLISFNDLSDDLVDIYVNESKIARGEIVIVDGHFGVKIVSFDRSISL